MENMWLIFDLWLMCVVKKIYEIRVGYVMPISNNKIQVNHNNNNYYGNYFYWN